MCRSPRAPLRTYQFQSLCNYVDKAVISQLYLMRWVSCISVEGLNGSWVEGPGCAVHRELRRGRIRFRGLAIRLSLSPNQMQHHWLTDWLTIQRWPETRSLRKAGCQPQVYDQTETKLKSSIRLNCVYNSIGLLFWKKEIQEVVNAGTSPVTYFPRRVYSWSPAARTRVQVRTMFLSCWELSQQCFANCCYS